MVSIAVRHAKTAKTTRGRLRMKNLLIFLLMLVLAVSLIACTGMGTPEETTDATTTDEIEETEPTNTTTKKPANTTAPIVTTTPEATTTPEETTAPEETTTVITTTEPEEDEPITVTTTPEVTTTYEPLGSGAPADPDAPNFS